jgi:hypothetical protein
MSLRIGVGSAWWGDRILPAALNVEQGDLDYLNFVARGALGGGLSRGLCLDN